MTGEVVFLGGLLNIVDPLFHLQLYIWSWILIAIFMAVSHVAWRYGPWEGYKALWGLYYAYKAESNAAFISGPQLYFNLVSEAAAKCIFDYRGWNYDLPPSRLPDVFRRFAFYYPTAYLDDIDWAHAFIYKFGHRNMDVEIARKLQEYEWEESPSTTIAGTRVDIILDADLWAAKGTPQHKAIEAYALQWNAQNPNNQIHSYHKLQRLMTKGMIEIPGVKSEITIPWTRIDASFPIAMEDNETAGYKRQKAEEESIEDAKPLVSPILVMVAGFGFAFVILIFRFVSFMAAKG